MTHARRFRLTAGALFITVLSGAPAPGNADQIWGTERVLLVKGNGGYRLLLDQAEVGIALPAKVRVEAVFSLHQRALVSGVTSPSPSNPAGEDLYLAFATASGLRELPAPPGRQAGISRERGVPVLGASGELAGLAWLEGERRENYAVRSAVWTGSAWSAPAEVAPPGPGSQLALAGTALDDGTALLVWARFDGNDDEIVFSRLSGGRWSEPSPIAADNRVPDIVPAVVAVDGGALAAWTRYDGREYRVVLARLAHSGWGEPRDVGPAGSVYPTLQRAGSGARLLFQVSNPRSWSVVELDGTGAVARRAAADLPRIDRPIVVEERSGSLKLRWADAEHSLRWN